MTLSQTETSNNYRMLLSMLVSVVYISCSKIIDNLTPLPSKTDANNRQPLMSRSIRRIEILLDLLLNNSVFSNILLKHISSLQKERENLLSMPNISKSWIFNEVSKLSNVIKYGTLKSSCRNYMETRISHLFAGLISFCDMNNNFDLLKDAKNNWISNLWMKMFNDEQFVFINYSNHYLQAKNVKEKSEFSCLSYANLVQNTLKDPKLSLKLPFSWIIKENLDNLTNSKIIENEYISQRLNENERFGSNHLEAKNENIVNHSRFLYEQLVNVFTNSVIHERLNSFLNGNQINEFVDAYLNDYLLLSSNDSFINFTHFKIFKKRVIEYCRQNYCKNSNDLSMLIGINLSFDELKNELQLFTKFAILSNAILDIVDKSDNPNVNLCYLASRLVMSIFYQ